MMIKSASKIPLSEISKIINRPEIKRRRLLQKLSLRAAATKGNLASAQQWKDIEDGKRDDMYVNTLVRVSQALGCGLDDLMMKGKLSDEKETQKETGKTSRTHGHVPANQ